MIYFVLLCGGKGKRTGFDTPKQYLTIGEKPVFSYSLDVFNKINEPKKLIIAAEPQYFSLFKPYIKKSETIFSLPGETREHTVFNALKKVRKINKDDIILIHDSARMFVTYNLVEALINEIKNGYTSAIPYKKVTNAIYNAKINKYIDKNDLKSIETPQCFNFLKLKVAYFNKKLENYLDDGSVFYSEYKELHFVLNPDFNLKLTSKEDVEEAERRINASK